MAPSAKLLARRAFSAVPLYRCLPPGPLRAHAGIRYLQQQEPPGAVALFSERTGPAVARYPSTAVIAARDALRKGDDELVGRLLHFATDRYPDFGGMLEVEAEFLSFQGDYVGARAKARRARLVEPASGRAAALDVRLSDALGDPDTMQTAIKAVQRFRTGVGVLWAAARVCRTSEQFDLLLAAYAQVVPEPTQRLRGHRPLTTAALRAGRVDDAIALSVEAVEGLLEGHGPTSAVGSTRLEGRDATRAVFDLCDTMDRAHVPFFFAAGSALGLVREGRPLDADSDIDIGIFASDYRPDELREVFRRDPRFDFLAVHPNSRKVKVVHRGGSPIDVFPFYEERGLVWHDGNFVRWRNTPFEVGRIPVGDRRLPVPTDPDRYLTENYGNWRVPDPDFDAFTEDAPNVEVRWPEYLQVHRLRRAYRHLTARQHRAAAAQVRLAGHDDLAARIETVHG